MSRALPYSLLTASCTLICSVYNMSRLVRNLAFCLTVKEARAVHDPLNIGGSGIQSDFPAVGAVGVEAVAPPLGRLQGPAVAGLVVGKGVGLWLCC